MIIKRIAPTSDPNTLLVLTDRDEKIRVPAFLAVSFSLCSEKVLSDEQAAELKAAIAAEKTKRTAVRILSQTAVSEKQLAKRLSDKGASEETAAQTVEWLKELKLLDDAKTAEMLVQTAFRKGYGRKRIEQILYEKSIPHELWEDALAALPESDDAIDRFIRQKLDGKTVDDKMMQKLTQALLRRGFSWGEIRGAVRRYNEQTDRQTPEPEDFT